MSKPAVRTVRFKVINTGKETGAKWLHLSRQVTRVRNAIWRLWSSWHTQQSHDREVAAYLADLRAWHKKDPKQRGRKPTCRVECLPPEAKKFIRMKLRELIPDLHERPMELTFNILSGQMAKMRASEGAFPLWMRVLADEEGMPSSAKLHPIPFSKSNSIIIPPASDRDVFSVRLRVDRVVVEDRKLATSNEDEATLQTRTRGVKRSGSGAILQKIAEGVYEHAGSHLHYHQNTREWFVSFCYRVPVEAKTSLDKSKVAFLRPARRRPWWLRIDGFNQWMGGRTGRHVAYVRQQLLTQRWGRQEAYEHAASARKGHGKRRAIGKLYMLRNRWQDFVKTANHVLAKQIVSKLTDLGYGKLVYFQPTGSAVAKTFLNQAGKLPGRNDPSGWDFSGLAAILAQLCQQSGIELIIHRMGDGRHTP